VRHDVGGQIQSSKGGYKTPNLGLEEILSEVTFIAYHHVSRIALTNPTC